MATYYAIQSGGTWNSASTWASSTGQTVGGAGIPTATDNVIIDSTMTGTITSDTGTDSCLTLNCTGCTGTLALSTRAITVSGNVTLGSGMTLTGTSGILRINASSTLISNGITIPNLELLTSSLTLTLGSSLTVSGTFTINIAGTSLATINTAGYNLSLGTLLLDTDLTMAGSGTVTASVCTIATAIVTISSNWAVGTLTTTGTNNQLNGAYSVSVGGNLTVTELTGTSSIILNGTGTFTVTGATGFANTLTINTSGTITLSGSILFNGSSFTYTAGTIVNTGSVLQIASNCTLHTNGMNFNNVIFGAITVTLTSNFSCTGILSNQQGGVSNSIVFSGAYSITCGTLSLGALTNNITFTVPATQTLTVTTGLNIYGNDNYSCLLLSATPSSSMILKYQGNFANQKVYSAQFTDVNAATSVVPIYNWAGSTLTRTTNIVNQSGSNIGGGGCIIL